MQAIGTANARFARDFLECEHIPLLRADLGGSCARRVDFRPAKGQARCRAVENSLVADDRPDPRPVRSTGDVELF